MICGNCCSPAVNILPAYTLDSASVSTVVYLAVELYSNLERNCIPILKDVNPAFGIYSKENAMLASVLIVIKLFENCNSQYTTL